MKKILIGITIFMLSMSTWSQQTTAEPTSANDLTSSQPQGLGITIGIYQPPTVNYGSELNAVNGLTNKVHGIVMYYLNWATAFDPFLQNQLNSQMAAADRPILMLAWGPAEGRQALGCDQNYSGAVPWSKIIQGACDAYIRNYANALKARPERFLLKFAHEMNGGGTPWSPIFVGVTPSTFVAAWQHVHDIFVAQGVTNVEWVWGPLYESNPNTAANDLHLYYPGDNYTDWVALSGYNYYDRLPGISLPWLTFEQMYDAGLKDFACRYAKPQMVHEMGSVEGPGGSTTKAAWIADAYLKAQNYPFLRSLVWYNDRDFTNPNADFRVISNTTFDGGVQPLPTGNGEWTNAYRNAVASSAFNSSLPSLANATPSSTNCGGGRLRTYLPLLSK